MPTRVTSLFVMAVLLGTVAVRLGCAWSCQPSMVTANAEHCHDAPATSSALSVPAGCEDVRASAPLLAATVRPDAAIVAPDNALVVFAASTTGAFDHGVRALQPHTWPPSAFAIPLRQ